MDNRDDKEYKLESTNTININGRCEIDDRNVEIK